MEISPRLEAIAKTVPKSNLVADIGCDHALLSIKLIKLNKAKKVIASDINAKPLEAALKNIKKYNEEKNIELRLGNGLKVFNDDRIETIVISGLGGETIVKILHEIIKYPEIKNIIISANNKNFLVRKSLTKRNYYIYDEKLVLDRGKIYTIISFKNGKKSYKTNDYLFGPILKKKKGSIFLSKWRRKLIVLKKINQQLKYNHFLQKIRIKNLIIRISRAIK